jgi:flagellar protein FliO/FliZ
MKIFPAILLIVVLVAAIGPLARAQEAPGKTDAAAQKAAASATPAVAATPITFSSGHEADGVLRLIGCFVLIAAMLGGALYFLKSGGFMVFQRGAKGPRKLTISETRMLGNRQFLVVAEFEEKKMLIGVCPGRIDYLCLLGTAEETFSHVLPEKPE